MRCSRLRLNLSAEMVQQWYAGHIRSVISVDDKGLRVLIPVRHLQRFVTREGVMGEFLVFYDHSFRLREIRQVS